MAFRIITAARDELVEKALKQTKENLAGLRKDHLYPALLRRLTKEALLELDGALSQTSLTWLEADPRDEKLLDRILRDWQLETPTSYGLDCWGGVRSRSADGRVVVINTLEARFERATVYLHRYLATLFEGKGSAMGIAQDEGLAAECLASTTAMPGSEQ